MMAKPSKPSPDFPLFPHDRGKWAKKIKGKLRYFGRWADPDGALAEYEAFLVKEQGGANKPAGAPLLGQQGLTVRYCCNLFLTNKAAQVESGEKSQRTFLELKRTCERLVQFFGRDQDIQAITPLRWCEFKKDRAKTCNPVSVGNEVIRVRTVVNWLVKNKVVGEIEMGTEFRKPSRVAERRHRRERGKKLYSAKEVHAILDESGVQLRAMILLGINCGYQNSDCERVPRETIMEAIRTGWLVYAREKTEIGREARLWKVTRLALRDAMQRRPPSDRPEAFLRPDGQVYSWENNDIAKRFRTVRDSSCVRRGGFSWLRKTFETAAGLAKDQVAVDHVMGHVDPTMAAVYRQEIQRERLASVSKAVWRWFSAGCNLDTSVPDVRITANRKQDGRSAA